MLFNWMMLNHQSLINYLWLKQRKAMLFRLIKSAISLSGILITSIGVTLILKAIYEGHRQVLALVNPLLTQWLFQATNLQSFSIVKLITTHWLDKVKLQHSHCCSARPSLLQILKWADSTDSHWHASARVWSDYHATLRLLIACLSRRQLLRAEEGIFQLQLQYPVEKEGPKNLIQAMIFDLTFN